MSTTSNCAEKSNKKQKTHLSKFDEIIKEKIAKYDNVDFKNMFNICGLYCVNSIFTPIYPATEL